jgi:hypothetical protein
MVLKSRAFIVPRSVRSVTVVFSVEVSAEESPPAVTVSVLEICACTKQEIKRMITKTKLLFMVLVLVTTEHYLL